MTRLATLWSRLTYLLARRRLDRDLSLEIAAHLEMRADELERGGMARDEALAVARREFGSSLHVREESREAWQWLGFEELAADVKFAVRMLARTPVFTLAALLTLALGLGATTALFSIVHGVLLRPLPYEAAHELVIVSEHTKEFEQMSVSLENFADWRSQSRAFAGMAYFRGDGFAVSGRGEAARVSGRYVSADFFKVLGVRPILGRTFRAGDDRTGAAPTVVISDRLWRGRFGGDPHVLDAALVLDGKPATVIGVLPASFWFYAQSDVFVPAHVSDELWVTDRDMRSGGFVVARLRPGVTPAQAQADLVPIARRLAALYPEANGGHGTHVMPLLDDIVGSTRQTLYLLLGAVGFVLLIAGTNVANLLLARAAARSREMAIRTALGAGRARVLRQLLTESVVLAVGGAAAGVGVAWGGLRLLAGEIPASLPRADTIGLNLPVLAFALALGVGTGLVFGAVPCWRMLRAEGAGGLNERELTPGPRHHRLQSAFVVSELAVALLLLVCAGLTLRSAVELRRADPGFDARDVLTFNIALSKVRYESGAQVRHFYETLVDRVRAVPGVEAAALTSGLPMRGDSEVFFYVVGRPKPAQKDMTWALFYATSPEYGRAMGLTLVRGRYFTERDIASAPPVVVVDEVLARGLFPAGDPIGQRVIIPYPGMEVPREIVGVVRHVSHWGVQGDVGASVRYQFYMPAWQIPDFLWRMAATDTTIVVRSRVAPDVLAASLKRAVQGLDAEQPLWGLGTMDEVRATSRAAQSFAALLLAVFAMLAVTLAAIGTFGVIAYAVAQRTREIGIRQALGATRGHIFRMVLRQGGRLAAGGVVLGVLAAVGLSRLLTGLLYNVSPVEPAVYVAVSVILVGVAALASYLPARRATHVDPTVALRAE